MISFHWTWLLTGLAVVGAVLNINKSRWGFACWMITNLTWARLALNNSDYPQVVMFFVFFALSAGGWWKWNQK